jgi:pectinesterase
MKKQLLLTLFLLPSLFVLSQSVKWTVANDGSGKYKTVQAALDAIPVNNKKPVTITIKNGTYREKLRLDGSRDYVTLVGEDKFSTILTYNDHTGRVSPTGDTINTRTSYSFLVVANNFTMKNITVQNDAGFTAGQAVGLEIQGDKAIITNCRIVGNQDILFTSTENSRQYFEGCYIEGTTDFIFGPSTAWFERCHIHSKKNSHVTAASTPKEHAFGYVFSDCILTGDTALNKVSLGRPWRPFASVTYMRCYLDRHINQEGWANWNSTESYKTARYAEYKNFGPGASTSGRVSWSRQLTDEEAKKYNRKNVFKDWDITY